ncbi:MAG: glycine cleavage system protein GcvH [Planctomycetes bacterium]|nr:glycine cleavage system protein GcvH [Planctomycetota bacterium]
MIPKDLKYSDSHEWIKVENGIAIIGITDYAVKQLSDLVHVELPSKGDALEQDSPFGEIESVKTVSELITPVSGKVVDVNTTVAGDLDSLNKDAYEEGWLIKIKMTDLSELDALLTATQYEDLIASEQEDEEEEEEEEDEEEEEEDWGEEEGK